MKMNTEGIYLRKFSTQRNALKINLTDVSQKISPSIDFISSDNL